MNYQNRRLINANLIKMKILIIGGGIFGLTIFLKLKAYGLNCILLEKSKKIMSGASTNNLNRIHLGYHYPRDDKTARQSQRGYKSFRSFFKNAVFENFDNYYLISNNNSKVNFKEYLKFCKRNKLDFKIIKNVDFFTKKKKKFINIQGLIKVNEPIYSWKKIIKIIDNKLKTFNENIYTNAEVLKCNKKNNIYQVVTKKISFNTDIVIDASYMSFNYKFFKSREFKRYFKNISYQITIIPEIIIKNVKKIGLAVMDGPFFSILPKGNETQHLVYHVKHSVVYESEKLKKIFMNIKKINFVKNFNKIKKIILKDVNYFLPNMIFSYTGKFFISKRVIFKNRNDGRTSRIYEPQRNYFVIASAKIDHAVDIANNVLETITKRQC
jgi:hypothetical protein